MIRETEHRGAFRRLVRANTLEDTGAIVQAVRADVDLGVGPVDELAVHPDLLEFLHGRLSFARLGRESNSTPAPGPQNPPPGPERGKGRFPPE